MIRNFSSATFALALVLLASSAVAENLALPATVTLELCGDVKAEEVQAALAIEYQDEEFGNTMLTVKCWGDAATLRIIGPSHPKGRIADVSLLGVQPVAKSRTIAVLAAELWTAPDPPELPASGGGAQPTVDLADQAPSPTPARFGPSYRSKLTAGVALLQSSRSVHAGRFQSTYGARGNFYSLAFRADWPALRWLGFFVDTSVSSPTTMAGHAELNAPVRWRRTEVGLYVPVWRRGIRVDLWLSGGGDTITAQGVFVRNSERTILPRYVHQSLGVDLAYALNTKTNLTASASSYNARTTDDEYVSLDGSRFTTGVQHQIKKHLRLDAKLESRTLGSTDGWSGQSYQDTSTSFSLALHYAR